MENMNILMIGYTMITFLIVGSVIVITFQWWILMGILKKYNHSSISLDKLVDLIKEEKEDELREKHEKELKENGLKSIKKQSPGEFQTSLPNKDKPIYSHGELIPSNLSDLEKDILREFYRND